MNQAVQLKRKKLPNWVYVLPLVACGVAVGGYVLTQGTGADGGGGYAYTRSATRNLDITIRVKGELQAVNNIDIVCEVEGSTTITSIVKEGASVKKGDVLVQLDSSTIRQKIDDTTLDLQKADADVTNAREFLEIQKSQNATNLEAAQVALEGAQIDLKKWTEGDYPQKLNDAQTAVDMARIDLRNKESDFEQVQQLAAKGFLTPTDVELRRVDLVKARNTLDAAETTLKNFKDYEQQKNLSTFRSALAQAQQKVVRTERENAANIMQKTADLQAKEQALDLIKRKLAHYKEQYEACTIKAPEDGLVVYATSGDRNAQQPIQEGAQVRERQQILRLPDTSKMKAVIRIQEAQVTRLHEGLRAVVSITGVNRPISGTVTKISVLADNSQRWWNPDLKEYPVDVELDETPADLKPGIGVDPCEILVARMENVTTVPIGAIYTSGIKSFVFVRPQGTTDPGARPKPIEVSLGNGNDTDVEVTKGLEAGQDVVVLQPGQGRELLLAAGIPDEPATRPAAEGKKKGRRGGGGGGGGGESSVKGSGGTASVEGK
jgi:HlyD family secretion protein